MNKAGESSPPDHLPFRRSHNATVEEGGSKAHLFNGFIKVAKHAIVALWPMKVDFKRLKTKNTTLKFIIY